MYVHNVNFAGNAIYPSDHFYSFLPLITQTFQFPLKVQVIGSPLYYQRGNIPVSK